MNSDQRVNDSVQITENLPQLLRQISDDLWDAAQRKDLDSVNALLDQREEVLLQLADVKPLSDKQRRELMAIRAADKYLMRQLNNELEWLNRRLSGLSHRRQAAAGYRNLTARKTHLTRTG